MSYGETTLHLTGSSGSSQRRELDFYPTPAPVTIALLEFLKLPASKSIWEPAAGNGAMSAVFTQYGHEVIETDIRTGDNYLTTVRQADAIITNPPFNLSAEFIEKAVKEAELVAMLLKSQYWHAAKRVDLFEKYPPKWVLPLTWRPDFLEHERADGEKGHPTMEVAWTIWDRSYVGKTMYQPLRKPKSL